MSVPLTDPLARDTSVCTHLETTIDQETYYRTKRHAISLCQLPVHVCTSVCMCIQAGIASRQCTSRYLPHVAHFERDKHCVCEERERETHIHKLLTANAHGSTHVELARRRINDLKAITDVPSALASRTQHAVSDSILALNLQTRKQGGRDQNKTWPSSITVSYMENISSNVTSSLLSISNQEKRSFSSAERPITAPSICQQQCDT